MGTKNILFERCLYRGSLAVCQWGNICRGFRCLRKRIPCPKTAQPPAQEKIGPSIGEVFEGQDAADGISRWFVLLLHAFSASFPLVPRSRGNPHIRGGLRLVPCSIGAIREAQVSWRIPRRLRLLSALPESGERNSPPGRRSRKRHRRRNQNLYRVLLECGDPPSAHRDLQKNCMTAILRL